MNNLSELTRIPLRKHHFEDITTKLSKSEYFKYNGMCPIEKSLSEIIPGKLEISGKAVMQNLTVILRMNGEYEEVERCRKELNDGSEEAYIKITQNNL